MAAGYPGLKFNPATLFSVIGSIFGGGKPDKDGAFNQSQFRPYSTERVSHIGDGMWSFKDPDLGIDVQFKQDDLGGFIYQDPRTGEWRHDQAGDKYSDPFTWNLRHEQQKIFQGGGPDSDYNLAPWAIPGTGYDPNKKSLPWQTYAAKSGPMYRPVTKETMARDDHFDEWTAEQKERNRQASERAAQGPNPFAGGLAGVDWEAQAEKNKQGYQGDLFKERDQYVDPSTLNPYVAPTSMPPQMPDTIMDSGREYFMGDDGVWKPTDMFDRETGKKKQPDRGANLRFADKVIGGGDWSLADALRGAYQDGKL